MRSCVKEKLKIGSVEYTTPCGAAIGYRRKIAMIGAKRNGIFGVRTKAT